MRYLKLSALYTKNNNNNTGILTPNQKCHSAGKVVLELLIKPCKTEFLSITQERLCFSDNLLHDALNIFFQEKKKKRAACS